MNVLNSQSDSIIVVKMVQPDETAIDAKKVESAELEENV